MSKELMKLVDCKVIVAGKLIKENNIVSFERLSKEELEKLPENERAYATTSMGRAIFTVDEKGKIHNIKGVNSRLTKDEIGPVQLTNAEAIEYDIPNKDYKISALVFNGKKPEVRINGTAPLEDLEIEGDINKQLSSIGVKVPQIKYIREFPEEYREKHGLPISVEGSLEDFSSDYAEEDDKRKSRLQKTLGENYSQELKTGKRPESMREYLERIGFLDFDKIKESVEKLGYSMDTFVTAVDKSYSRGQRYGQTERLVDSPFRVSDIEIYIKNNEFDKLSAVLEFTEGKNKNFATDLAEIFGKNIATLLNNGWECENLIHRQDFSITGEFCDDAYFNIKEDESLKSQEREYIEKPYKLSALKSEHKRRYTGQVLHIASCIKIIQDAMRIAGKDEKEIDEVLNSYVESFAENLNFEEIARVLGTDQKTAIRRLEEEFSEIQFQENTETKNSENSKPSKPRNWVEKMAGQDRKNGLEMDDAIYYSHAGNEDFYSEVANRILEKIKERDKKIDEATNEADVGTRKTKTVSELFTEVSEEVKDVELLDKIKSDQTFQRGELEEKTDIFKA